MSIRIRASILPFVTIFLLNACTPDFSGKRQPSVINGEIDLTGWDFKRDGPVSLNGDWLFSWKKFVKPAKWEQLQNSIVHTLPVPGHWRKLNDPVQSNKRLPGTGFASYVLRITGISDHNQLAILFYGQDLASRVEIASLSGEVFALARRGIVSNNKDSEVPSNYSPVVLNTRGEDQVIILQQSSHHYIEGGIWQSIVLGTEQQVDWQITQRTILYVLMVGFLLIIGLYHLILFSLQKHDKAALFFALFCLFTFARYFSIEIGPRSIFMPSVSDWAFFKAVEYLAAPAAVTFFARFLNEIFRNQFFSMLARTLSILSVPLILMTLIADTMLFTSYRFLFEIHVLIGIVSMTLGLLKLILKRNILAGLVFFVFVILSFGVANDLLYINGVISSGHLTPYTICLAILLQGGIISYKNGKAHKQAEALAVDLQSEIKTSKELQQSNQELEAKQIKYGELIDDLSTEYVQAESRLNKAKNEQQQVVKELAEASDQLIQAEKLSVLGTMVSGIAHDINNPLNFIETARFQEKEKLEQLQEYLLLMVPEGEEGEDFKNDLLKRFERLFKLNSQVEIGVKRVTEISRSMLNVSRFDTEKAADINLVDVLDEAITITSHKVKQFQLLRNDPAEAPLVSCNRSQIGQVIMNFLSNAADAITDLRKQDKNHEGVIQIDLAISSHNNEHGRRLVRISVADNGSGVDSADRQRILQPFFTSKAVNKGTGLGLSICAKIAESHGGQIEVGDGIDNKNGGLGARFTLEFEG